MGLNTLLMTVGLPRSGKSTTALSLGLPIVSPDAIRLALHGQPFVASAEPLVWATAKLMVAALFEAGHERVVLDACNGTIARRDEWADPRWRREFVEMSAGPVTCVERAMLTGREDIIPVIQRMAGKWEPVIDEERVR